MLRGSLRGPGGGKGRLLEGWEIEGRGTWGEEEVYTGALSEGKGAGRRQTDKGNGPEGRVVRDGIQRKLNRRK